MLAVLVTFSLVLSNLVVAAPTSQPVTAPSKQPSVVQHKVVSSSEAAAKISPRLKAALQSQSSGQVQYLTYLKEQADTSNNISPLQWKEKGDYVYNKLTEVANRTQPSVTPLLTNLKASKQISTFKAYWIFNGYYVKGDSASINALAFNDSVASLDIAPHYDIMPESMLPSPASPDAITPGVSRINAPAVWAQGYLGQGVTVGSIDSGALYQHEAINRQWRGTMMGSADYNWYDAQVASNLNPVDYAVDSWHGSHTIGTILGEDAVQANQIGVAPKANWISCRALSDQDPRDNATIFTCGQWMLAPTDHNFLNPRPELRPQIVSNSWGTPDGSDQGDRSMVINWLNAGMFPNFSNGNNGPGVGTVGAPGSYPESFGVGATGTLNDTIASFSSRGPSPIDGGLKPQVTAPGVNVLSVQGPGTNTYGNLSGTSMAQPHVAGTLALLLSKNRSLTVQQLKDVLTSTAYFAIAMGTRPNNNYGWGRIDALAAANAVTATNGTLLGRVVDGSGNPVVGASIGVSGTGSFATFSNPAGYYTLTLSAGTYAMQARKYSYIPTNVSNVMVMVGMTMTQNFTLTTAPLASVSGNITGPGGTAISATISISPAPVAPVTSTGSYSFTVAQGTYEVVVTPNNNCLAITHRTVTVPPAATLNIQVSYKTDAYGYTCDNTTAINFIAGTTQVTGFTNNDDGVASIPFPAGFLFNYYGQTISPAVTLTVGTNGYIEFGGSDTTNSAPGIPNIAPPNNAIYVNLNDMVLGGVNGGATGNAYYGISGTAPNRKFVIEWRNVQRFVAANVNEGNYTFEIVLEEGTSNVYFQYLNLSGQNADGNASVVGQENATGTDGISYSYLRPGSLSSGFAVKFTAPVPTGTPTPTVTSTAVVTGTPTVTSTAVVTGTPTVTSTPLVTATATPCSISFTDVPTTYIFYGDIQFLACRGVVSGANGAFGPNNNASRGQFAKIAVLGFGIASFTPVTPTFVDVPANSVFYGYIEAAAHVGVVNGLTPAQCAALGTPGTCYGPNVNITRAQTAVIVQRAKNYALFTPTSQTFSDVPSNSFAYAAIETLAHNNIINGAACGTSLCFRPNDNIKRGELSKVVRRAIETAP